MRQETSSSPRQGPRNQTTAVEGCAKRDARNRAASRRRFDGAELSIPLREQKAQNGMGLYSTKSFCIWMESVWLRLGSGPRRWSGRSVWVFLALGRFAAKNPAYEPWISLDFLDSLVRIETFQWVTRILAGRIFLPPFPQARKRRNGSPTVLACGSAGLSMGQAYPGFWFSARDCRPRRFLSAASIQRDSL